VAFHNGGRTYRLRDRTPPVVPHWVHAAQMLERAARVLRERAKTGTINPAELASVRANVDAAIARFPERPTD